MTLTQTWVQGAALGQSSPSLAKDGCRHPSCPHGVPLQCHATPRCSPFPRVCLGWGGLVWGGEGSVGSACAVGGRGGLTAWYLLGRQGTEAKVAVPAPAFPLALYRRAPKCRWCRQAGRCVSRRGWGGTGCAPTPGSGCPFQLGSVARVAPPHPTGLTMKVLGCVCAGAQGTMGKGPDAPLSFLLPDNVPAWLGD